MRVRSERPVVAAHPAPASPKAVANEAVAPAAPDQFTATPAAKPLSLDEILATAPKVSTLPRLREALADPAVADVEPATLPVPAEVLEVLEKAQHVLVLAHVDTDSDAVGGALGLSRALETMGKKVDVCVDSDLSASLRKLDGDSKVKRPEETTGGPWDLVVVTDCGQPSRLGGAQRFTTEAPQVLVVDHHEPPPAGSTDVLKLAPGAKLTSWVVPESDAASLQNSMIISKLAERHGQFTKEQWASIAVPLMAGYLTDSGFFTYPSDEAISLQMFKHLLTKHFGGDLEAATNAFDVPIPRAVTSLLTTEPRLVRDEAPGEKARWDALDKRLAELKKTGQSASLTKLDGGVGVFAIPKALMDLTQDAGRILDPKYNAADLSIAVKEAIGPLKRQFPVVALLREVEGGVSCSFRSQEDGPALSLAQALGGGGHGRAGGASVKGATLAEVTAKIEAWAKAQPKT